MASRGFHQDNMAFELNKIRVQTNTESVQCLGVIPPVMFFSGESCSQLKREPGRSKRCGDVTDAVTSWDVTDGLLRIHRLLVVR